MLQKVWHTFNTANKRPSRESSEVRQSSTPPPMEVTPLATFFKNHPGLAEKYGLNRYSPHSLKSAGQACWRAQQKRLQLRREKEAFAEVLHGSMIRETGILALLEQLLEAARLGDQSRWELYRGYLLEQVQALDARKAQLQDTIRQSSASMPVTEEELVSALELQLQRLSKPAITTEYEALLIMVRQIRKLSWSGHWYAEVSCLLQQELQKLEPELQQALLERFHGLQT